MPTVIGRVSLSELSVFDFLKKYWKREEGERSSKDRKKKKSKTVFSKGSAPEPPEHLERGKSVEVTLTFGSGSVRQDHLVKIRGEGENSKGRERGG